MARKPKSKRAKSDKKSSFSSKWIGFNDKEKEHIKSLQPSDRVSISDLIEEYAGDGWKIGVSYSFGWSNWVMAITAKEVSDFESDTTYLLRHSDFERVVDMATYFFSTMVPNMDTELEPEEDEYSW